MKNPTSKISCFSPFKHGFPGLDLDLDLDFMPNSLMDSCDYDEYLNKSKFSKS